MNYRVMLDEAVVRKIAGWELPERAIRAIIDRLDELSDQPSRNLIRVDSLTHVLQSDLVIADPGPPGRNYLIVLIGSLWN